MKRVLLFSLVGLLVVGAGLLLVYAKEDDSEKMIAAAKALDQKFMEAFNKGDVDALMSTYWNSPDLVVYPPGAMEWRGWQAAKESFKEFLANMKGAKLQLTEPNYKVAGDVVMSWGKWRITMPTPDGKTMDMMGRYTDVKTKKDGKWVYIIDHASAPLPPPPAPEPKK